MPAAPTGRIGLVFTDVESSTERWEREGDAFRDVLDVHDRVMRDAIRAHGGYEVKTEGDAFMLAFASVEDALRFCETAQAQLHLPVRMGLHVAATIEREDSLTGRMDYFGPGVNRAARIASAAHGRQVLLSSEARAETRRVCIDLGEYLLKGIEGRHRVWQFGQGGFPALRALAVNRSNLPTRPDSFFGRVAELAELHKRVRDGHRLVTLLGIGGAGKTRLAQRFAGELLGDSVDAAWFVDLSSTRDAEGVCGALASALDIPLRTDPIQQISWALRGRGRVALVLDNAEQVVDALAPLVGRWLESAPELRVVITSRGALRVRGEEIIGVEPLPIGDGVALFMDRAHLPVDGALATRLVEAVDGLPLTIELAAARTRSLPMTEMLARTSDRFRLLAGPRGDRPDRHATLRAMLDWSWDLLSPAQRDALTDLSVFRGSFTFDAAEAVVGPEALDLVPALVDQSLVRLDLGSRRFGMLESVRLYAGEHHGERRRAAESRHGAYFSRHGEPEAMVRIEKGGLGDLALDTDELAVAVHRGLANGEPATAIACALAVGLIHLHGVDHLAGLAAVRAVGHLERRRGEVRRLESRLLRRAGRGAEASAVLDDCMGIARDTGDSALRGAVLHSQATHLVFAARREEALVLDLESLAIHGALGDLRLAGQNLSGIGDALTGLGRMEEAMDHYARALAFHRATGDRRAECHTHTCLGILYNHQGRYDEARRSHVAACNIAEDMRDTRLLSVVLTNLGEVHRLLGQFAEARVCQARAIDTLLAMGNARGAGIATAALGSLLRDMGELDAARERFDAAESIFEEVSDKEMLTLLQVEDAALRIQVGEFASAGSLLDRAEPILRATGAALPLGMLHCHRARLCQRRGTLIEAERHIEEATRIADEIGARTNSEIRRLIESTRAISAGSP